MGAVASALQHRRGCSPECGFLSSGSPSGRMGQLGLCRLLTEGTRDGSTVGKFKLLTLFGRSSQDQISTWFSSSALLRSPIGDDSSVSRSTGDEAGDRQQRAQQQYGRTFVHSPESFCSLGALITAQDPRASASLLCSTA